MAYGTPGNAQELRFALSTIAQTNASTPNVAAGMFSMLKNDKNFVKCSPGYEDDAPETGKGDEFPTQRFLTAWSASARVEKYLSAEMLAWCIAYLGASADTNPNGVAYRHTGTVMNTTTSGIEPPYITVLETVRQGANAILDRAHVGMCLEGFQINVQSGVGRGTSTLGIDLVGTGQLVEPSGITVPALTQPHELPSASLTFNANGVDYIGSKLFESLSFAVKNNLAPRYIAGGGFQQNGSGATAGTVTLASTVITAVAVTAGGTGYNVPPAITVTGGGGSGAVITATTAGGIITGFVVVFGGTGYTSAPTINIQPAGYGSGAIATSVELTGNRQVTLSASARYVKGSPERAFLNSLTNGTAGFSLKGGAIAGSTNFYDGNFAFPAVQFAVAEIAALANNRIGIQFTVDILEDPTNGVFTGYATNAIQRFALEV